MEFDYNKCPECGYINDKRPDVCPSCGFDLKEYRNNFFEQQVRSLFDTVKVLRVLFEETDGKFSVVNDNIAILEKEYGIDNDNKTPETYQKGITKIKQSLKDIERFKEVFDLISNYQNCDKYKRLLNEATKLLSEFQKQQKKSIVNFDKSGAQKKAIDACVVNGAFKINFKLFDLCGLPTDITIPDKAIRIGKDAFLGCRSLQSVTIGNNITRIGDNAFSGCSDLTNITIPESVTSIGDNAFSGCSGLKNITIPESVTSIGDNAFDGCSGLTSITIPDSITKVGYGAFDSIENAKIPAVAINGLSAHSLKRVEVTSGDIQEGAFRGFSNLTSVTMGNSVTSVGKSAFSDCSKLKSVIIGNGVTSIKYDTFSCCGSLTSLTIGNSVTSIEWCAFDKCSSLKRIYYTGTIDEWVSKIEGLNNIKRHGCANKFFINGKLLTEANITTATKINEEAFYGCESLTSVTIGDSVMSIGSSAFNGCSSLTSVTIGKGVTSIANAMFEGCKSLTVVTIGNNVTTIERFAFGGCNALKRIDYKGTKGQWQSIKKTKYWADHYDNLLGKRVFSLKDCKVYCADKTIGADSFNILKEIILWLKDLMRLK